MPGEYDDGIGHNAEAKRDSNAVSASRTFTIFAKEVVMLDNLCKTYVQLDVRPEANMNASM